MGAFPVVSGKVNRYIMVMLDYDSDYSLVEPMHNRATADIIRAHHHLMDHSRYHGGHYG